MKRSRGFSIIEFMIAMTLSLIVLSALTAAFVSSSRSRDELDRANQQMENGRYSVQVLSDDLSLAGYFGQLDQYCASCTGMNLYYTSIATPDPCLVTVASMRTSFPFHVQGIDNVTTATKPTCIDDVKTGTDIVVVRRASTCVAGSANCAQIAGAPYFQASLCGSGTELASSSPYDPASPTTYGLSTDAASLTKHKKDCTAVAELRRYLVRIYYVANNDQAGDKIPTLKRAELDLGTLDSTRCPGHNTSDGNFCITSVAQGVQDLQIEYGIDANGDGQPDTMNANPAAYTAAVGLKGANCPATPADCAANWLNIISARINILARSTSVSPKFQDQKAYVLGKKADGTDNVVTAANDGYRRHVFQATVWMNNPAARRAL